jgi:uncharacterized DUF497 family protein
LKYGKDYLLRLRNIIWIDKFTIKIQEKHNLIIDEVEDALLSGAIFRRANRGKVRGENVYVAYGKTNGGRYLFIVFIYKQSMEALIISARDMTLKEQRYYNAKKR